LGELYHLCKAGSKRHLSSEDNVVLTAEFGHFNFLTSFEIRERMFYFTAKVGTPELVNFDLNSDLATKEGLEDEQELKSTVHPGDSASCITPRPLNTGRGKGNSENDSARSEMSDVLTQLTTRIAELTNNIETIREKKIVGDYTRLEYDLDLQEAFNSSGVVNRDGQLFVRPLAHTSACELVPKLTIDDRLNFLIRLHTAIFKLIPNTDDYPRPGISEVLRNAMDGKLIDDHPSYDLLQIVVTDTFDWNHDMIKNNNFVLPILEPGMRFNERIIALCLRSLKQEYMIRWSSLVKDCILPKDVLDSSRWSDSYDPTVSRKMTAKRPDLAARDRDRQRRSKRRRDSVF